MMVNGKFETILYLMLIVLGLLAVHVILGRKRHVRGQEMHNAYIAQKAACDAKQAAAKSFTASSTALGLSGRYAHMSEAPELDPYQDGMSVNVYRSIEAAWLRMKYDIDTFEDIVGSHGITPDSLKARYKSGDVNATDNETKM